MHGGNRRLKTRTALVAGGAGFVGSHLCDALLAAGHGVICVDSFLTGSLRNVAPLQNHRDFKLVKHDVCDALSLPHPVDWVFNLACAASPQRYQADPVHTMMTSVAGAKNLLSLAQEHGAVFVQASTSEIYGDPEEHPQREDYLGHVNCTGPRACYDEGKRAAEALCFDFLRAGRVDARVARIFNTYGPRMQADDGRIVSNLIVQALKGEPLTVYGSGEQTRSFCYVSDLVRGLIALMEADPNPGVPINLGNPHEFSINELVEMVLALIPTSSTVACGPLPADDPQRRRPDIGRARKFLGWEPRVALPEGLRETVAWFDDSQPDARSPEPAEARRPDHGKQRDASGGQIAGPS
jgi:UDP-glucuronate decarboxylase